MSASLLAAVLAVNILLCSGDNLYEHHKQKKCEKSSMSEDLPERAVMTSILGYAILCDTKTDGGGWILIMRRCVGEVNFARPWSDYRDGFGTYEGDFWQGLEQIHQLTYNGGWELRVDMKFEGRDYYANYKSFKIDSEDNFYKLHVGDFSGNVGDDLSYQNGMNFSTTDSSSATSCTMFYRGGWWYNYCHHTYLTGEWGSKSWAEGIHWDSLSTSDKNLDSAEMKIRSL
ncbi:fibrinogen C domain-containing protein 1-like [Physella acuta]|uniref:fibrinogen C domain-containing protein 1-like n=1 Tax=Physella acuta TaxID=109671 RepID=UPI0027DC476A|nr:fibrinogen C domain-containing protein 1-like [Physella acuta]